MAWTSLWLILVSGIVHGEAFVQHGLLAPRFTTGFSSGPALAKKATLSMFQLGTSRNCKRLNHVARQSPFEAATGLQMSDASGQVGGRMAASGEKKKRHYVPQDDSRRVAILGAGKLRAWPRRASAARLFESAEGGMQDIPVNTRDDLHLERKLFHFIGGLAFVLARLNFAKELFVSVVGAMGITTVFFEVLRIRYTVFNKFFYSILSRVMRKHEADHFSGMAYYMLGVTATCAFFHETIAVIGILALTIGDPVASLVGQSTRKVLPPGSLALSIMSKKIIFGKSVAGTLGFFVSAAAFIGMILSAGSPGMTAVAVAALVLAPAAMGAVVELMVPSPQMCLPFKYFPLGIDDNLVLPFLTSLSCHFAWLAAGSPPIPVLRRFVLFG